MSKFVDKCVVCSKEYLNYEGMSYRPWCSVGCQYAEIPHESESEEKSDKAEEQNVIKN